MARIPDNVLISKLGLIEIQPVLAIKVRSGHISQNEASLQRARLMADIAAGLFEVWSLSLDHFSKAEWLIGRCAFSNRLRTLDALQLGGHWISAVKGAWMLLSRPTRLEELPVLNPEDPSS
jgi:hypothetical protein